MSRTPAALAARLKTTRQDWAVDRDGDGWRAKHRDRGYSVGAPTVTALEILIGSFDEGPRPRPGPQPRARGAGARVP